MPADAPDQQTVTLQGDNGQSYECRLLGVIEFDNKDYALLLNLGDRKNEADTKDRATVIMRFIERDGQTVFRTIESDEEFNRVVAFLKERALDASGDEDSQR
jgi:uncharacterized protein YrzB (UPF0473 family)